MRVGAYEIVSELGRGGMGVVYRARAPWGAEVALKQLLAGQASRDLVERFARERRLLASFGEREGFVALLDAGTSEQGPFLVMPLLTGGTLDERLEKGPLETHAVISLGRALARALGIAHARGVVHRDLKPENVLFDAAGRPFISDLGLAKHFRHDVLGASQSVVLTEAGDTLGTVGYMSPEQAMGQEVVASANVFSLGLILHECLTGKPAFSHDQLTFLVEVQRGARPQRGLPAGTPPWLRAAIERAIEPDRTKRFLDGAELARALAGPRPRGRRVALLLVPILAVALAVIGALLFFLAPRHPEPKPPPPAAARTPREEAVAFVADGVRLAALHDNVKADAAFAAAQGRDPSLATAWAGRGELRLETDDVDGALADLEHAIQLDPDSAPAHAARAVARSFKGDAVGALADGERAVALDPNRARSWAHLAVVHHRQGLLENALADAEKALALDARCVDALLARAETRREKRDLVGSRTDLDHAVELDPRSDVALIYRAHGRFVANDIDGAQADVSQALERFPGRAKTWSFRAEVRLAQGDFEGAIADANHAIELGPTVGVSYARRALARAHLGDSAGATEDLEVFGRLEPGHPDLQLYKDDVEKLRPRRR